MKKVTPNVVAYDSNHVSHGCGRTDMQRGPAAWSWFNVFYLVVVNSGPGLEDPSAGGLLSCWLGTSVPLHRVASAPYGGTTDVFSRARYSRAQAAAAGLYNLGPVTLSLLLCSIVTGPVPFKGGGDDRMLCTRTEAGCQFHSKCITNNRKLETAQVPITMRIDKLMF